MPVNILLFPHFPEGFFVGGSPRLPNLALSSLAPPLCVNGQKGPSLTGLHAPGGGASSGPGSVGSGHGRPFPPWKRAFRSRCCFCKLAGTRRAKRNGREAGHPRWGGGRFNKGTY